LIEAHEVKVYIDTNILSNLLAKEISNDNLEALDKICDYENLLFVTSQKTLDEFMNTSEPVIRISLKTLYKIINKIPLEKLFHESPAVIGNCCVGDACLGGGVTSEDPLFRKLKVIFDSNDAEHIFHSIKDNCHYFLTLDEKSILNRISTHAEILQQVCPNMTFVNPTLLLELLLQKG